MLINDWAEQMQRDYLTSFIKEGGAAVKFIVGDRNVRSTVRNRLNELANEYGYLMLKVDSSNFRVHMPQDIFFSMARQVDWRLETRRFLVKLATADYDTGGLDENTEDIMDAIATRNDVPREAVWRNYQRSLGRRVHGDKLLAKDFRLAISELCAQQLWAARGQPQPVVDWLTGANKRVRPVRQVGIFNQISRTTARHVLRSACYWFHQVGYTGTVLVMDNGRVTERVPRVNRISDSVYYSKTSTMDHYEVMREFIDGTELLDATLVVACYDRSFLDDESSGVRVYPALRNRITNEVYAQNVENPAAALCRLEA